MPKAEVGSTKYLNNKLKSKGLQRLRWYCQICERQMRDENGFKCHTQSEGHVRAISIVGENASKFISDYSSQFQSDFMKLLRTAHGEKKVHMNHFYQEYIADKQHIHMNATRWPSLTEFAKHLGREGLCRVEDTEKGLQVAWIDNSPEALRRHDALRKKERQDRGDEEREQKLIRQQIERAEMDAAVKEEKENDDEGALRREDGEKIKLNLGIKPKEIRDPSPPTIAKNEDDQDAVGMEGETNKSISPPVIEVPTPSPEKVSLGMSMNNKPKNVFAAASKKTNLNGTKPQAKEAPRRPMSEAERIMKEEIERKRMRESHGAATFKAKRPKIS